MSSRHASARASSGAPPRASPVISAWIAAQQAFENAARTADVGAPELAATTVAPELPWSESLLAQMSAGGEGAQGPVAFDHPRVVRQDADLATVRACVHDEEIVISMATGEPAPGPAGQVAYELFTSTMARTNSGWKLETETVGVGQCRGS